MAISIPSSTSQEPNKTLHPNDRILRWPEVHRRVGICRSHAHQLVSQGRFPAPIKLASGPNSRASGWLESEIDYWIGQRIIESRHVNVASLQEVP